MLKILFSSDELANTVGLAVSLLVISLLDNYLSVEFLFVNDVNISVLLSMNVCKMTFLIVGEINNDCSVVFLDETDGI